MWRTNWIMIYYHPYLYNIKERSNYSFKIFFAHEFYMLQLNFHTYNFLFEHVYWYRNLLEFTNNILQILRKICTFPFLPSIYPFYPNKRKEEHYFRMKKLTKKWAQTSPRFLNVSIFLESFEVILANVLPRWNT